MLALSIRQPYAELILRGVKTIEYRTVRTHKIGERFYIYASKTWAGAPGFHGFDEEALTPALSPRELELELDRELLPVGVIVGSAIITSCQQSEGRGQRTDVSNENLTSDRCRLTSPLYEWHLTDVKRYKRHRKPTRQPQPVWFRPFAKAA